MKHQSVVERVLALFKENGNTPLTYNELVYQLRLVKKEKSQLSESLQELAEAGKLSKQSRKYRLTPSPPQASEPQERKKSPRQPEAKAQEQQPPQTSSRLIEGIFDATPLAKNQSYAFVRTEQGDFFVGAEDTLNAYHNDVVAIEPHFRRGKSDRAQVRRVIRRANASLAGEIHQNNGRSYFVSSNRKIHNWFEVNSAGAAKEGEKVILHVSNWGSPLQGKLPVGDITEVLGLSGDPEVELMAVIRQYQLPLEFEDEVLEEANRLPEVIEPAELVRRTDLREIFTFTIDPASAKDFDDAISLEKIPKGWRLYVHIADVAHYVKLSTQIFLEASKRGNSFYFPKKVIPMLPERLSNRICSLRPDEDKLTMTVITEFDAKGKVLQQKLAESVIRSDFRLSYEQVDALFEGQATSLPEELTTALNHSRELSALLSQKRLEAGYIFFDLPELEYEYDDEGLVNRLTLADETESHKLIENFMLVANEYIAKKLSVLSPTTMYRIHEDPDYAKLDKVIDLMSHYGISYYQRETLNASVQYLLRSLPNPDYHKVFDRIVLRSLKKAIYTTKHERHFGLGMETYTHFTSPIRRLCDLVIHHLCKIYLLHSSREKISPAQVKRWANIASEQELQADQAERDIELTYSMAYMKTHVGEKFSGMVISAKGGGLIVRLNEIPVNAMLRADQLPGRGWNYRDREMRFVNAKSSDYYQLLDKVMVQIIEVSDDIYLELQSVPDNHRHVFDLGGKIDNSERDRGLRASRREQPKMAVDDKRGGKKSGNSGRSKNKRK